MIPHYATVMQSPMSLFRNAWCRVLLQGKLYSRRFAPHGTCSVRHSNSTKHWFHEDRSQCSISGRYTVSLLLYFVCSSVVCNLLLLGLSYFTFIFAVCLSRSNLSLFSVKARVSISNGMLFLRNKSVRWAVYPASFASLLQACISHLGWIFYCHKLYAITRIFPSPGSCTYATLQSLRRAPLTCYEVPYYPSFVVA